MPRLQTESAEEEGRQFSEPYFAYHLNRGDLDVERREEYTSSFKRGFDAFLFNRGWPPGMELAVCDGVKHAVSEWVLEVPPDPT